MFHNLSKLLDRITRRKKTQSRLVLDDSGATLFEDARQIWSFDWKTVNRIHTYKLDLYTVDMICVDFFTDAHEAAYQANDDMEGFEDLCQNLRNYFASIPEDWWAQVAFPAFESNHKVLYKRGKDGV